MDRNEALLLAIVALGALLCAAFSQDKKPDQCIDDTCPREALIGSYSGVVMDLPPELREPNWGGGSCVHASTVMVLRHQGQYEMADWWRQQYSGGEYSDRLIKRMESANLRYAYTVDGDFEFLRWCVRTRRGCGIFYKPSHAINLIGMDDRYVYLLDNNDVTRPERDGIPETVPINEFIRRWKGYGGFGFTVVYTPNPPKPKPRA